MPERIPRKHLNILAASILVASIAGISLVLGPINELGATGKWTAMAKSVDGSTIIYSVRGQGQGGKDPALVFIHGWTCNRGFWTPQIEHFSKTHKVISLDLAGHGSSDSKRNRYTMGAFGHDVMAVVEETGADSVVLVGHSMGGPAAIEAADLLKGKVIGIVAVDIFPLPGLPSSKDRIDEFMKPFEDDFKAASERFVRSMFLPEADPDPVTSIVSIMSAADETMAIGALRETIEWLIDNDPSLLRKYASKLHNINAVYDTEIPQQTGAITIPEVGHFIAQVKPDAFNGALERILSEYRKSRPSK
ncbi:MAG: Pimeloyl-ACP methyl ester carboxylesterase [Candidatus Kentron sp. G]|nr:MAG: Pimeloyl-ACP methyl ester carboxylesterase [Candidatus Kentron sp. G]VFM97793.1 MAG: Pimeloyl-ACP methyl ester carboxylesterase [Candidatus Kentron sp. G]VFN04286.1 MAG: Pimeloyl-ACP methyl ester carboxylesterase [Candidatus Kentron sp. G]